MHFDWDERKNLLNQRKHSVSFAEARDVFFDENAVEIDDPDHSAFEPRFLLLDLSRKLRILIDCHCYREQDDVIRIISARKANAIERKIYGEPR